MIKKRTHPPMSKKYPRPDKDGAHRQAFERNKKRIYATADVCAICGKPVDKSLKFPHPMSKCIDHIIPINKGGHPSDMDNLQMAHLTCNRLKSDKILTEGGTEDRTTPPPPTNRDLPKIIDWENYRSEKK